MVGVPERSLEAGRAKAEMYKIVFSVNALSTDFVHGLSENLKVVRLFPHSCNTHLLIKDNGNSTVRGPK